MVPLIHIILGLLKNPSQRMNITINMMGMNCENT